MLYLEDKRKVKLFEIIGMKETEIKKAFKIILKEYDDVVFQEAYDIKNCQMIKHVIRFLNEIPVINVIFMNLI